MTRPQTTKVPVTSLRPGDVIHVSAIIGSGPERAEVTREPGAPFRDIWQRELIRVRLRIKGKDTARDFLAGGKATLVSRAPLPEAGDLRAWPLEDLLVTVRAAGQLWHSTSREDPLDVLSERQIQLLDLAAASYLVAPANEQETRP